MSSFMRSFLRCILNPPVCFSYGFTIYLQRDDVLFFMLCNFPLFIYDSPEIFFPVPRLLNSIFRCNVCHIYLFKCFVGGFILELSCNQILYPVISERNSIFLNFIVLSSQNIGLDFLLKVL